MTDLGYVNYLQVMRGGVQVRERSKSCAVEQTPVADEQSFERSVSLPDVIEKKTPNFLAQGGQSIYLVNLAETENQPGLSDPGQFPLFYRQQQLHSLSS